MPPLDLQAERFTATGNIASEGMRNQLGRPRLDRLAVLVREAAQNSWDAKRDGSNAVTFGVACYSLSDRQLGTLRDEVFAETPADPARRLAGVLDQTQLAGGEGPLRVLALYDRGTTGLGGPTRADAPTTPGEARDFVDFLRNVGQPPDKSRGGGTFGYGKAALYLSSAVDTILVHTRCCFRGRLESRFIASVLTEHYELDGLGYTGRHWAGRLGSDGIVDPVLGRDADNLARRLGMPIPGADEQGTTILLLAPRFGERSPEQAMRYLQAQMLWNFWPKMVPWDYESGPRMNFQTQLDGEELPMPNPASVPPFGGFVEALHAVRRAERTNAGRPSSGVTTMLCQRPKKKLGLLSLRRIVRKPRPEVDYGDETELPDFVERCHHVALLRRAELVVSYHPGPALPNDYVEYVGVFLADDELDRVYAASEPPTHDEWRPENLADRRSRTFVRTTFKRINATVESLVKPSSTTHAAKEDQPLARLSSHLGGLLVDAGAAGAHIEHARPGPSTPGPSTPDPDHPPTRRKRRSSPKVELSPEVQLLDDDGVLVRVFRARVTHTKDVRQTELHARVQTILVGGAEEREAPEGAEQPRVVAWQRPSGAILGGEERVVANENDEGIWEIRVAGAPRSLVALDIQAKAVSP